MAVLLLWGKGNKNRSRLLWKRETRTPFRSTVVRYGTTTTGHERSSSDGAPTTIIATRTRKVVVHTYDDTRCYTTTPHDDDIVVAATTTVAYYYHAHSVCARWYIHLLHYCRHDRITTNSPTSCAQMQVYGSVVIILWCSTIIIHHRHYQRKKHTVATIASLHPPRAQRAHTHMYICRIALFFCYHPS